MQCFSNLDGICMKTPIVVSIALLSALHTNAFAEICGTSDPNDLPKQADCLEKSVAQSARAIKMLEQRLGDYLAQIEKLPSKDPELKSRSIKAVTAQNALKDLKAQVEKAGALQGKVKELTLKSAISPPQTIEASAKKARELAKTASSDREDARKAEEKVYALVAQLAGLDDLGAQQDKLKEIQAASVEAAQKKKALETKIGEIVTYAGLVVEPAEASLVKETKDLYSANEAALIAANKSMVLMLEPVDLGEPLPQPAQTTRDERVAFLKFLESHPLLESELSGPGLQISSTSGDGKVTVKPEFLFGRRNQWLFAVSASAPINKETDDGRSAAKSNALLDKLAGDTTIKFEGSHLNPSPDGKSFILLGGSAEVGYKEFTYFDDKSTAELKKLETHEKSYKLSVHAGFSPKDYNDLFLVRYSRQRSHEGQPKVAICKTSPTADAYITCPSGSLGAPTDEKFNIVSAEWRHSFDTFAIAPTLSYDRSSKIRALALPFYVALFNRSNGVFGKGKPGLTAGVQLGWRSDTKGSFGVFAGTPFTMVKAD